MALPVALAAGVLPDIDHLLDYYVRYVKRNNSYTFYLLHGWEYLIVGTLVYAFVASPSWLLAMLVGYFTQLAADQIGNRVTWRTYFISIRARYGFRSDFFMPPRAYKPIESVISSLPIGTRTIARAFTRMVARWSRASS